MATDIRRGREPGNVRWGRSEELFPVLSKRTRGDERQYMWAVAQQMRQYKRKVADDRVKHSYSRLSSECPGRAGLRRRPGCETRAEADRRIRLWRKVSRLVEESRRCQCWAARRVDLGSG